MQDEAVARFRRAYWRAFRDLDTLRLRIWEQSRVTLPQIRVLFQIQRKPMVTIGELSRSLGITVSTTSGLAAKLAERGLIERLSVADDRRQVPLRLTEEGIALLGELADATKLFVGDVAERLGPDLPAVTAALERLADAAAATRPRGPAAEASSAGASAEKSTAR